MNKKQERPLEYTITVNASVVVIQNNFVAVKPKTIEYSWKPTAKHIKASNPMLLVLLEDQIKLEADKLLHKKLEGFRNADGTYQRRIDIELVEINRDSFDMIKKPRISVKAIIVGVDGEPIEVEDSWQAQKHDVEETYSIRYAGAVEKIQHRFGVGISKIRIKSITHIL